MPTLVDGLLSAELAERLRQHIEDRRVWVVGGALRDHFLELDHPDLDFAVDERAISLARSFADDLGVPCFVLDADRDAARVMLSNRSTLDIARLRAPSIESDLEQRDFTMNALAVDLEDPTQLIDPLGGLQDLRDRLLRACGPNSIQQDAIRALRAVRLASALKLRVDEPTKKQIRHAAGALKDCAPERKRDELSRMLESGSPATAMRLLHRLELSPPVLPETASLGSEEWSQTVRVVEELTHLMAAIGSSQQPEKGGNLSLAELSLRLGRFRPALEGHLGTSLRGGHSARLMLSLAALFSQLGDSLGLAYARLVALRYSVAEAARVRQILRAREAASGLHGDLTDLDAHRYYRSYGAAGVEGVLLHLAISAADSPTQEAWEEVLSMARQLLEAWFEKAEQVVYPSRMVRGDEILEALGLAPGPIIGEIMSLIAEGQVEGSIGTREEALEYAAAWIKDKSL